MQVLACALLVLAVLGASGSTSGAPGTSKTRSRPLRGFADVDPRSDEALKVLRAEAGRFTGGGGGHVVAPHVQPKAPQEVQKEVERLVERAARLSGEDRGEAAEIVDELEGVEASLAKTGAVGQNPALEREIDATRVELCGLQQKRARAPAWAPAQAECEALLKSACAPGRLKSENAAQQKVVDAACVSFRARRTAAATATAATAAAASKKAAAVDTAEGAAAATASKAAASAAAAPAGAAPAGPGVLGGKKERPLPAQGYGGYGGPVEHNDQETYSADWGAEFGPHSGARNFRVICREHPNNEWCRLHGYYDTVHSGSVSVAPAGAAVLLAALAVLASAAAAP